jgi:tRNA threonylcarbamoyladenosine biosynthesis protein TsaE
MNISDESAMRRVGCTLAKSCDPLTGIWIYLSGELGAGKTTFVRGFLQGLGLSETERVKSPTYTLLESYEIQGKAIYHFDFYRIKTPLELTYLGLEEYFTPSNICLVEWPDDFMNQLPIPDIFVFLTPHAKGRELRIESKTARGASVDISWIE